MFSSSDSSRNAQLYDLVQSQSDDAVRLKETGWFRSSAENLKENRDCWRGVSDTIDCELESSSKCEIKVDVDISVSNTSCSRCTWALQGLNEYNLSLTLSQVGIGLTTRLLWTRALVAVVWVVVGSSSSVAPTYRKMAELIPPSKPFVPVEGLNRIPTYEMVSGSLLLLIIRHYVQ